MFVVWSGFGALTVVIAAAGRIAAHTQGGLG